MAHKDHSAKKNLPSSGTKLQAQPLPHGQIFIQQTRTPSGVPAPATRADQNVGKIPHQSPTASEFGPPSSAEGSICQIYAHLEPVGQVSDRLDQMVDVADDDLNRDLPDSMDDDESSDCMELPKLTRN